MISYLQEMESLMDIEFYLLNKNNFDESSCFNENHKSLKESFKNKKKSI